MEVFKGVYRALDFEGGLRVCEGDTVQLTVEGEEIVEGIVTKLSGKDDKAKIQLIPNGEVKEEIWSVQNIEDLRVL